MSSEIIECEINFLSYERACSLVPPEFVIGYEWYQSREGESFRCLPHRDKNLEKPSEIKICADRGIHGPSYASLKSQGAKSSKPRYALAVHSQCRSSSGSRYNDQDLIFRPDGTWIFDYCCHRPAEGSKATEKGNEKLMNNLYDGVPVAVLIQQGDGSYLNCGLAYVERFDCVTGMFTLHGPVSAESINSDFASIVPKDQLREKELKILEEADHGDHRKRVFAEQIRRERQTEFRKMLLEAYGGKCAVTETGVPEVLQAAHIDPYRGRVSQVVTNGILLRSDIHLLYDSHLLTVEPDTYRVIVADCLEESGYSLLDGKQMRVPRSLSNRPDDNLLDMHMKEFLSIRGRAA